jgi:DnaJ-class molecular chaperone
MTIRAGPQGGQKLRVRGQGRGDQYVEIRIVIPPMLTGKKRDLMSRQTKPGTLCYDKDR